jgi:hypothetical protein
VLEAQAGHLSKRMSDHYKHISERAARKASEALSRAKADQRAEARAKIKEQARVDTGLIHSDGSSSVCVYLIVMSASKGEVVGGRGLEPRTSCL